MVRAAAFGWTTVVSDIFQEVDEDLRRDRMEALWKRYGRYLVGAAAAIVLVTAGWVGWRDWQAGRRAAEGGRFMAALEQMKQGRNAEAAEAFAALAEQGGGIAALARLRQASALIAAKDVAGAIKVLDMVAADTSADEALRNFARLQAAMQLLDSAPLAEIEQRLAAVAQFAAARPLARELEALAKLKAGDAASAKSLLTGLADDAEAPAGVRARAAELLAALGAAR